MTTIEIQCEIGKLPMQIQDIFKANVKYYKTVLNMNTLRAIKRAWEDVRP